MFWVSKGLPEVSTVVWRCMHFQRNKYLRQYEQLTPGRSDSDPRASCLALAAPRTSAQRHCAQESTRRHKASLATTKTHSRRALRMWHVSPRQRIAAAYETLECDSHAR